MGRVYSLILQRGEWERTGGFKGVAKWEMVVSLLENFTGPFFQSFFIWFFNRDLLRRPVFLISSTDASD